MPDWLSEQLELIAPKVALNQATTLFNQRRRSRRRLRLFLNGLGVLVLVICGSAGVALLRGPAAVTPLETGAGPSGTTTSSVDEPPGIEPTPPLNAVSTTWISERAGWILSYPRPCEALLCELMLLQTNDGGETWSKRPLPKVSEPDPAPPTGMEVRFANRRDGWLRMAGGLLWSTHDGGATWNKVNTDGQVISLEAANEVVHIVTRSLRTATGFHGPRIFSSPINQDAFTQAAIELSFGAGPVPVSRLDLVADRGWLVINNRAEVDGAMLISGTWTRFATPCRGDTATASLAAASATDVVVACGISMSRRTTNPALFESRDGGTSFSPGKDRPEANGYWGALAHPAQGVMLDRGQISTDGGANWSKVSVLPSGPEDRLDFIGFTTPTRGVALSGGKLYTSEDSGRSWTLRPINEPPTTARLLPTPQFVRETHSFDWGKAAWRLSPASEGIVPTISGVNAASEASHSPGGDPAPDEILYGHLLGSPALDTHAWVVVFRNRPCGSRVGGASALPTTTIATEALCDAAVAIDANSGGYLAAVVWSH